MFSRVSKNVLAAQSLVHLTQTLRQSLSMHKMLSGCFLFKEMSMVQKPPYPALVYLPVSREVLDMATIFYPFPSSP